MTAGGEAAVSPAGPERAGAWRTMRRGLSLSPELGRGLAVTLALALAATAGRVIIPVSIQQVVDRSLTGSGTDMRAVILLLGLALLALLVTAAATGLMHVRLAKVSEAALSGLRIRAFRHIHNLSMLHQAAEQRGVLVARVTSDVDQISRFMQWAGLMIIVNTGQAIAALAVMAAYSLPLFAVVAASLPVILLVIRMFQTRLHSAYLAVRVKVGEMLAALAEAVAGFPVIRAYGTEQRIRLKINRAVEEHRAAAVRAGGLASSLSGVTEVLTVGVATAVIAAGSLLAADGRVSVGTVVAFLFLVQLFIQPVQVFGEAVNEAQTAVAGWRRVLDVLDLEPDVTDPGAEGVGLPDGSLDIRFERVSFAYPGTGKPGEGQTAALLEVDVEIAARSNVAVVGETGSGKTTFAKLLTRLMDPAVGRVMLGGTDVSRVRFESLRERVVMVPQEGAMFRGSILDNVRMGKPDASLAEVERTFVRLDLAEWLEELTAGLETQVGERGSALSVGERQLVTLVRAAIADPEILVLDEATSAVDPATEVHISKALRELSAGRTVVTVAHRMSTAEAADRVLVFDHARLVQDGTHIQLVAEGGHYGRLYEAWQQGTAQPAPPLR